MSTPILIILFGAPDPTPAWELRLNGFLISIKEILLMITRKINKHGINSIEWYRFLPMASSPHRVRTHELILNFLFRLRQSPSVDGRTKKKQVLFGFVSSCAQCCVFSRWEKGKFKSLVESMWGNLQLPVLWLAFHYWLQNVICSVASATRIHNLTVTHK